MTVAATARKAGPYAGDGVNTEFPFAFKVFSKADVGVVLTDADGAATTLILDSDYSVLLNPDQDSNPGGTITYPIFVGPSPLPAGSTLTMIGDLPYEQPTDITNNGRFLPQVVENALDRVTILTQQLREIANRTLQAAVGTTVSLIFPAPSAGKFIRWRSDELGLENAEAGTDSMTLQGLLADSTLKTRGGGMIGYTFGLDYPDSTVGAALEGLMRSVKEFGAKGDGATNDDAARAAAEAASSSVYWPEGTYLLTTAPSLSKSWGPGKCYVGGNRVYLRPTADPAETVFAELMDVPVNELSNASPSLQRAVDFAQANKLSLTLKRGIALRLDSQVIIKQGTPVGGTLRYQLDLIGNNVTLLPNFTGLAALYVQPQCLTADRATGRGFGVITIRDLNFSGFLQPSAKALQIGRDTYIGYDLRHSELVNCSFEGFIANASVVDVRGVGNWRFSNVTSHLGQGWQIGAYQGADFTGDLIFDSCQFAGSTTINSLNFSATAPSGLAEVRGVKFDKCNIYDGKVFCSAGANGTIADFWIRDSALSVETTSVGVERTAFELTVASTGQAYNIYIVGNYIAGWPGRCILFTGSSGANMQGVQIQGNTFGYCNIGTLANPSAVIHMNGFNSMVVTDNQFHSNTADAMCYSLNARGFTFSDNRSRDGSIKYGIQVGGTSENFVVQGNAAYLAVGGGGIVNDFSSGVNKSVVNNLAIATQ